MSTLRALLRRVCRVNKDDLMTIKSSLIFHLLTEIIEAPRDSDIPIFQSHFFSGTTDSSEIFHNKKGGCIGVYECLRDAVVNIIHPWAEETPALGVGRNQPIFSQKLYTLC